MKVRLFFSLVKVLDNYSVGKGSIVRTDSVGATINIKNSSLTQNYAFSGGELSIFLIPRSVLCGVRWHGRAGLVHAKAQLRGSGRRGVCHRREQAHLYGQRV